MVVSPVRNVIRISDPDQVRPAHVVMVCLVCATLAGVFLMTGGAHREILHDGAVEWGADSPLRAVVEVLNLQFSQTTARGVAIKSLVFGMGTAAAVLVLGLVLGVRPRQGDEVLSDDLTPAQADALVEGEDITQPMGKKHIPLLAAAQFLMLAYGAWSFASMSWSNAPAYALGGSVLLGIQIVWAFALGLGLNRVAARAAALSLVVICLLAAVLAIAYHAVRNPTLRASYPIGNPLLLAACLIPGILIGVSAVVGSVESIITRRGLRHLWLGLAGLLAVGVLIYAFSLTRSRGPLLGVLAGACSMVFFRFRGRARIVTGVVLLVGLALAGWYFTGQRDAFSSTGRSATIRVRLLAWGYAFDLAVDSPLTGQGQGGYCLLADAKAAGADALADP
ncbi:MAG: O-antigen ligase family protein, partial [Phycisphaerae bacterium]